MTLHVISSLGQSPLQPSNHDRGYCTPRVFTTPGMLSSIPPDLRNILNTINKTTTIEQLHMILWEIKQKFATKYKISKILQNTILGEQYLYILGICHDQALNLLYNEPLEQLAIQWKNYHNMYGYLQILESTHPDQYRLLTLGGPNDPTVSEIETWGGKYYEFLQYKYHTQSKSLSELTKDIQQLLDAIGALNQIKKEYRGDVTLVHRAPTNAEKKTTSDSLTVLNPAISEAATYIVEQYG